MTHAPEAPTLVVRGPDSLPALVPHLVGFSPHASLVVLGLGAEHRAVRVTLRLDLPPEPGDLVLDLRDDPWTTSVGALLAADAREAVLVVYPRDGESPWRDPEPADLPWRDLVDGLADRLRAEGIGCLDAVCVVGDRLRSYWCLDPDCCPMRGRLVDERESLRVRSLLVGRGSAPLDSREALVRSLAERDPDDPVRLAVDRARGTLPALAPRGIRAVVSRYVDELRAWGADQRDAAALSVLVVVSERLCASIRSRDLLLRSLTVDPDPDLSGAARVVLGEAVRCSSGTAVAPVASVLAVCCWVSGDGAAARVAVERALDADPAYSLAGLVSAALDTGAPPWAWVSLMEEVSVSAILGDEADGTLTA